MSRVQGLEHNADFGEMFPKLLDIVRSATGCTACGLVIREGQTFDSVLFWLSPDSPGLVKEYSIEKSPCQALYHSDAQQDLLQISYAAGEFASINDVAGRYLGQAIYADDSRPIGHLFAAFATGNSTVTDTKLETFGILAKSIEPIMLRWFYARKSGAIQTQLVKSNERYTLAQKGARDAIWDWDIENNAFYISEGVRAIPGLSDWESTLNGESALAFMRESERKKFGIAMQRHLRGETDYLETEHQTEDSDSSKETWVLFRGVAVRDETGRAYRMAGSITDVTERKRIEDELTKSKNLLSQILESLPATVFAKDIDGHYVLGNKEFCDRYHLQPDDFIGKTVFDILPGELAKIVDAHDKEVLASGEKIIREEVFNLAAGTIVDLVVKTPMKDEQGEIKGILAVQTDIGDQKQAERDLQKARNELEERVITRTQELMSEIAERSRVQHDLQISEQRFKDIAEVASDWIWEMDADLCFSYISDRFFDLTETPKERFIGKSRLDGLGKDIQAEDREKWDAHIESLLKREPFATLEYPILNPSGNTIYIQIDGRPVFDENNEFQGYRGCGRNITDRILSENSLKAAIDKAESADRAKSEFLAKMSHELRTPLNAIIGITEMIEEDLIDQSTASSLVEPLARVHRAGDHLLNLINEILDLSKIEAGRVELEIESLDLRALINDVVLTVKPLAVKNANKLEIRCPESFDRILGDSTRIRQILYNLLSNACKFTQDGVVSLDVNESVIGGIRWLEFNVTDSGIGIHQDQLDRLFVDFAQAETRTAREFGGTGLGLAITKKICGLMGGNISVESEYGKGSIFKAIIAADLTVNPVPTSG